MSKHSLDKENNNFKNHSETNNNLFKDTINFSQEGNIKLINNK